MTQATQYGFYVDSTKCSGCKACHVSCKDRQSNEIRNNSNPEGNTLPSLEGVTWRRVYEYGGGEWTKGNNGCFEQNVFAYYMSIGCNHCSEPVLKHAQQVQCTNVVKMA